MDAQKVLDANDAFYRAFREANLEAMDRLTAREHPVAIIHPGWPAVSGRTAVMETWAMIFTGGMQDVGIVDPEAFLFGNTAFVINYESTGGVFLVATNHFVLEDGEWRLTHHQGGPVSAPAPGAMVM